MALANLNSLTQQEYFDQLYAELKLRENEGLAQPQIHNGGGDGNPTFGYGFNLAGFSASIVEQAIRYAFTGSLVGALAQDQEDGLGLVLAWKNQADVVVGGQTVKLTRQNIIDMAAGTFGDPAQIAAVQSLSLNDVQATRLLDVAVKGEGNLVHIEGPANNFGFENGLDFRLTEEGGLGYSTERVAFMSLYYNRPTGDRALVGAGLQNALLTDNRAAAWYEIRYNHGTPTLQDRRAQEAEKFRLVSKSAVDDPSAHTDEFAQSLSSLFNDNDFRDNRIYVVIQQKDANDNFEVAIADELSVLRQHLIEPLVGAANAVNIDWVQFDTTDAGSTVAANDAAAAGVTGGKSASDTVNLILGNSGNDQLSGKGATDYLFGGADNDILIGDGDVASADAGDDLLHGGAGTDTATYASETGANGITVTVTPNQTAEGAQIVEVTDTYGKTDTLISIEMIIGTSMVDTVDLNALFGAGIGFDGGGGDDNLDGSATMGDVTLFGGEGFDTVKGGEGDDLLANIHAPSFDYSSLDAQELDAVFDSEIGAGDVETTLAGGAGDDIYLIDFSSDKTGGEELSGAIDFVIEDSDPGTKIFLRDISTGKIDALGKLQEFSWIRPAFTVPINADGLIGSAQIPSVVHRFYGFIGSGTGAFYLVGFDQYAEYRVELTFPGGVLTPVVVKESDGDRTFGQSFYEPFDPDSAVTLRRFDSIQDFFATSQFSPPDPGDGGFGGYVFEQNLGPGVDLAFADRSLDIFLDGITFAELGIAQLSDLGLGDGPPPPPSVSNGVVASLGGGGSATITGTAGADQAISLFADNMIALFDGDDLVTTGAGDDQIDLGVGEDYADSGDGADMIIGGLGADTLIGGGGDDVLDGGAGSDRYEFNAGFGFDTIVDFANPGEVDRVAFRNAINAADIELAIDPSNSNNLVIAHAASGSSLTVQNYFLNDGSGIDEVVFSDGTTWDRAAINGMAALVRDANQTLYGTTGADTLTGGTGHDTLQGGAGSDSYNLVARHGNDFIKDVGLATDIDIVTLDASISPAHLDLYRTSGDFGDLLLVNRVTAESVEIDRHFAANGTEGVEEIRFADGTVWNRAYLRANAETRGTNAAETIFGTGDVESLRGGLGADTLNGKNGGDTYLWSAGDGNDVIDEFGLGGDVDRLVFDASVSAGDVRILKSSNDFKDLFLVIESTGERIEIDQQFQGTTHGIEEVAFADGTVWDRTYLVAHALMLGTVASELLRGNADAERIRGQAGDDTLLGNGGSDDYLFGADDGYDLVDEFGGAGEFDRIIFDAGVAPTDLLLTRGVFPASNTNTVFITNVVTGSVIEIDQQLGSTTLGVEEIRFADGTVWDRAAIAALSLNGAPVALDLDGDGVELISSQSSEIIFDFDFDFDDDGVRERGGWVAPDDGVLALDRNGDGRIGGIGEISFLGDAAGARSDLEGLGAFDSDGDDALTANDDAFSSFLVWQDRNSNGVSEASELRSLADLGIRSLSPVGEGLLGDGPVSLTDNSILRNGTIVYEDGRTSALADVALRYQEAPAIDAAAPYFEERYNRHDFWIGGGDERGRAFFNQWRFDDGFVGRPMRIVDDVQGYAEDHTKAAPFQSIKLADDRQADSFDAFEARADFFSRETIDFAGLRQATGTRFGPEQGLLESGSQALDQSAPEPIFDIIGPPLFGVYAVEDEVPLFAYWASSREHLSPVS